jgi:hypothetical protein
MTTSPDTPKTPNIIGVPGSEPSRQESLIEYPSQFPIKVMGQKVDGMVAAITAIATSSTRPSTPAPSSCAKARPATTWA